MNEGNGSGYEVINTQNADVKDWSQNCVPIGLAINGESRPWLELSREDVGILHNLLTKSLTLVTPSGLVKSPPLAQDSEGLRLLAGALNGFMRWHDSNPKKVNPHG